MQDAAVRTRLLVLDRLLQHEVVLQQPEQAIRELERREKRKRRPDDQAPEAALHALDCVAVGLEAVCVALLVVLAEEVVQFVQHLLLVGSRRRVARCVGRRIDGLSESGYIVKVTVETNSARMSEV